MFGLFKKKAKYIDPLKNWQIPIDESYEFINNGDSIQYINDAEERYLYFSTLLLKDDGIITGDMAAKMEPTFTRRENSWQFKGVRQGGKELLVCAFTFKEEDDKEDMRRLFDNIIYKEA